MPHILTPEERAAMHPADAAILRTLRQQGIRYRTAVSWSIFLGVIVVVETWFLVSPLVIGWLEGIGGAR